ncbi:MAG: transcriptional repressor [Verrucomicrobia bacterium]|nr:transcriptional repressor [Verrucomicrobiota bacterium]
MPTTATRDALLQRLADSGLRSTPQREVVYNVLLDQRDHPTAEEVFARVKPDLPTISLATVYNCLETLVQCHLVRAVNFERSPTRYCPNLRPHAHFHDEQTGRTFDIDLPEGVLSQVNSVLPCGFDASSVEITFRGLASGAPSASTSGTSAAVPAGRTAEPPRSPATAQG